MRIIYLRIYIPSLKQFEYIEIIYVEVSLYNEILKILYNKICI